MDYDFFKQLLSPVTPQHLRECNCCVEEVNKEIKKQLVEADKQIKKDSSLDNTLYVRNDIQKQYIEKAYDIVGKKYMDKGIKCQYEEDLLKKTLSDLSEYYDTSNPQVKLRIYNILNRFLKSFKLSMMNKNITTQRYDRFGNVVEDVNPTNELELKEAALLDKLLNSLDEITEGKKVNVDIHTYGKDLWKNEIIDAEVVEEVNQ